MGQTVPLPEIRLAFNPNRIITSAGTSNAITVALVIRMIRGTTTHLEGGNRGTVVPADF